MPALPSDHTLRKKPARSLTSCPATASTTSPVRRLAGGAAGGPPAHDDFVVGLGGVEAEPWARRMIWPAQGKEILEDRLEKVDRHDHVERLGRPAFTHLLHLQRSDAEKFARASDHRGPAPKRVRRRSEDRFVEDVFPIAGEFLLGGDARHHRMLAPA